MIKQIELTKWYHLHFSNAQNEQLLAKYITPSQPNFINVLI